MLAYTLASSGLPTEAKFQVSLLSRGGGWWIGLGEIENKAKLSPAGAGDWTWLVKNAVNRGHHLLI